MSTITKCWSPLLESYFGEKEVVFTMILCSRGDTFSVDCKDANLDYKLDLRVIAGAEKGPVEAFTGEFASVKATACGKYCRDKLKSILASKCHLNSLLEKFHFLPESQVSNIRVPILQVMVQNSSLYVFSLIDKQIYSVQNVIDVQYPRNYRMIRDGGINKTLKIFRHIDISRTKKKLQDLGFLTYFCSISCRRLKNYSQDTSNNIKNLTGQGSPVHFFKAKEWTSEVKWEPYLSEEH